MYSIKIFLTPKGPVGVSERLTFGYLKPVATQMVAVGS